MQFKKLIWIAIAAVSVYLGVTVFPELEDALPVHRPAGNLEYDVLLEFPAEKYPETAAHIQNAVSKGHSPICTIDREGAEGNRRKSLQGIPTKKGFDRDEWPMAMCGEGGEGADIEYISPTDNRGAGSWVGNKLDSYADGTRVLFQIEGMDLENVKQKSDSQASGSPEAPVVYNSCAEAKEAGAAPLRKGDPGYSAKLDRDGDGIACQ